MSGGNNWPLRGRKGTLWEGGVRGVGFIHGKPLGLEGVTHKGLLHISDWFPTILEAASCPKTNGTQPLDGYNQWDAILQKTEPIRKEILHNIDPLDVVKSGKVNQSLVFDTRVRAGIRSGKWKLLTGNPGFDEWVKPPESQQLVKLKLESTDPEDLVFLFNIEEDPYEHQNLASANPSIVEDLLSRLAEYNATAVPVRYPPNDPLSNPKYNNGYWGPWVNTSNIFVPK